MQKNGEREREREGGRESGITSKRNRRRRKATGPGDKRLLQSTETKNKISLWKKMPRNQQTGEWPTIRQLRQIIVNVADMMCVFFEIKYYMNRKKKCWLMTIALRTLLRDCYIKQIAEWTYLRKNERILPYGAQAASQGQLRKFWPTSVSMKGTRSTKGSAPLSGWHPTTNMAATLASWYNSRMRRNL